MRLTDLPVDLILEISKHALCPQRAENGRFFHVYECGVRTNGYGCLSLASSCHILREIFLPTLLKNCYCKIPYIYPPAHIRAETLPHIQYLRIRFAKETQERSVAELYLRPFMSAVRLMRRLTELEIEGFACHWLWQDLANAIMRSPCLENLTLTRCQLSETQDALLLWPSSPLRRLEFNPMLVFVDRSYTPWRFQYELVPASHEYCLTQARAMNHFLSRHQSSLEYLSTTPDSLLFEYTRDGTWQNLQELDVRGPVPCTKLPLLDLLYAEHFPKLNRLDIEVVNTFFHSYTICPWMTPSVVSNPPIRHLSLINRHYTDPVFSRLPNGLLSLTILSTMTILDGFVDGFDKESIRPMSASIMRRYVLEKNDVRDLTFLQLSIATEPDSAFFASLTRACPALERVDLHVRMHFDSFLSPDFMMNSLRDLRKLKIVCLMSRWSRESTEHPAYMNFYRTLQNSAERLCQLLPTLKAVAYGMETTPYRGGWHVYYADKSIAPLSSMNSGCSPVYTRESEFVDFAERAGAPRVEGSMRVSVQKWLPRLTVMPFEWVNVLERLTVLDN